MLIITLNIIRRKNLQQENFNLKLVDLLEQQERKKHPFSRKKPPAKLKTDIGLDHLGIEGK